MTPAEIIPTPKLSSFTGEGVQLGPGWGVVDESRTTGIGRRAAELFALPQETRASNVTCSRDTALGSEAYRVDIAPQGVTVTAGAHRGFLHALSTLRQLRDGPCLPVGSAADYPRLGMRGIQLMFECFRQLDIDGVLALLDTAAKLKLNTVLLEFGDRFPFEKHAAIRAPSAFTRAEVRRMVEHAQANGIEAIPLLQSLGHLNYMLRHDAYADVREEDEKRQQMCPSNDRSFALYTELAEEVLDLFPGCTNMHIGADETRQLGVCPRCAASSKGELYARHTNKVCEWLSARGITPIIWDDMLCAHPDAMEALHPSAAIMYWDYWTTAVPSPLLVARYDRAGKRAIVCDERWSDEWRTELDSTTAGVLDHFAGPVRLEDDLTGNYMTVYGDYLGESLPKFIRAFPYLEYYQDKGRRVIGGPSCSGNRSMWYTLPPFPRHNENIKSFADRCIEAGAAGLITTAWYNRLPELLYHGMIVTAESTW